MGNLGGLPAHYFLFLAGVDGGLGGGSGGDGGALCRSVGSGFGFPQCGQYRRGKETEQEQTPETGGSGGSENPLG